MSVILQHVTYSMKSSPTMWWRIIVLVLSIVVIIIILLQFDDVKALQSPIFIRSLRIFLNTL